MRLHCTSRLVGKVLFAVGKDDIVHYVKVKSETLVILCTYGALVGSALP